MKYNKLIILSLLFIYITIGAFLQLRVSSNFKSLPSPLYGGDYYCQAGSINHIRYGGNPLESSSMQGGIPGYLPVYGMLVAYFANFFHLDTFKAMFYFSVIIFVLSSLIWFYLFKLIFGDNWIALVGTLLANNMEFVLKYTDFSRAIMLPLFIIYLYKIFKDRRINDYVILGVIYGLMTLSHMVMFVGATLIMLLFVLYEFYEKYKEEKMKGVKSFFKQEFKGWLILALVSSPILMLYWYKPLFIYHLHRVNKMLIWNVNINLSTFGLRLAFLFKTLHSYLFNFNFPVNAFVMILIWISFFAFYTMKKKKYSEFLGLFAIFSFLVTFSYFITLPLLHMHFVPNYLAHFYLWVSDILLSLYALKYVGSLLKLNKSSVKKGIFYSILILFIFINVIYSFSDYIQNDSWIKNAKNPIPSYYTSLQSYLLKNTNINDVILSTKELSFAVNALTGRKLVVNRWAHYANPYIYLSQRDIDAAVILYGNDTDDKSKLIHGYNVSYFFWGYDWQNSEFQMSNDTIIAMYDPMIAFDKQKYKEELLYNNVSFSEMNWWVDPALHNVPKFDLVIISPKNYYNETHPWSPNLDKYLVKVWHYDYKGQEIAALYKIRR